MCTIARAYCRTFARADFIQHTEQHIFIDGQICATITTTKPLLNSFNATCINSEHVRMIVDCVCNFTSQIDTLMKLDMLNMTQLYENVCNSSRHSSLRAQN